jgi:hypothetical protein
VDQGDIAVEADDEAGKERGRLGEEDGGVVVGEGEKQDEIEDGEVETNVVLEVDFVGVVAGKKCRQAFDEGETPFDCLCIVDDGDAEDGSEEGLVCAQIVVEVERSEAAHARPASWLTRRRARTLQCIGARGSVMREKRPGSRKSDSRLQWAELLSRKALAEPRTHRDQRRSDPKPCSRAVSVSLLPQQRRRRRGRRLGRQMQASRAGSYRGREVASRG